VPDDWTLVTLPTIEEAVRKQAGKVVIFKITGEAAATPEQIAATTIPPSGKILVPLSVWRARKAELTPRLHAGELGVWLESFELVEDLVESVADINTLPLIALHFPRFADGRGFSMAALLRTRYGYRNELRAIGDVLRDQLYYLSRCGFDAFALRADQDPHEALSAFDDFSDNYPATVDRLPLFRRRLDNARNKEQEAA
jgi:uncharacterized protein (DUF934 family)